MADCLLCKNIIGYTFRRGDIIRATKERSKKEQVTVACRLFGVLLSNNFVKCDDFKPREPEVIED